MKSAARTVGWLLVLMFVAQRASADQPVMKIGIVTTAKIYGEKAGAESVQSTAAERLHALGVEALQQKPEDPKCRTPECLAKQQTEAGATHVMFVNATYRRNNSYAVTVALIDSNGREVAVKQGKCDLICTKPDMNQKLGELIEEATNAALTTGFTKVAASQPLEASGVESKPALHTKVTEVKKVSATTQMPVVPAPPVERGHARAWALIGAGAVVAGVGAWIWAQDGNLTSCRDVMGGSVCTRQKETTLGGGLTTAAGSLAILAGVLDLAGMFGSSVDEERPTARMLVGPASVALAGRF